MRLMAYLLRKATNLLAGVAMLFELKNAFGVSPGTDHAGILREPAEYRFENSPGFSAILWSFSPVFLFGTSFTQGLESNAAATIAGFA